MKSHNRSHNSKANQAAKTIKKVTQRVADTGIYAIKRDNKTGTFMVMEILCETPVLHNIPTRKIADFAAKAYNGDRVKQTPAKIQKIIDQQQTQLDYLHADMDYYGHILKNDHEDRKIHLYDRQEETYLKIQQIHQKLLNQFFA